MNRFDEMRAENKASDEAVATFNRKVLVYVMIFSAILVTTCCGFAAFLAVRLT